MLKRLSKRDLDPVELVLQDGIEQAVQDGLPVTRRWGIRGSMDIGASMVPNGMLSVMDRDLYARSLVHVVQPIEDRT